MERFDEALTPDLARAGRALAQVGADVVAEAAGLDIDAVRDFEKRGISLPEEANARLRDALEEFGVVFVAEDTDAGGGVRRKHTRSKVRQLDRWEDEGGPAYEDDV